MHLLLAACRKHWRWTAVEIVSHALRGGGLSVAVGMCIAGGKARTEGGSVAVAQFGRTTVLFIGFCIAAEE